MSNRLFELDRQVTRKTTGAATPKHKHHHHHKGNNAQPAAPAVVTKPSATRMIQATPAQQPRAVSQGLSGKVAAWRNPPRPSARAFTAISYDVPGNFWVMAQPSEMSCWATVFTMMKSWRVQQQKTIAQALTAVGQRWLDIFNANTGLSGADKPSFISAAGLAAEPPQSFSVAGWEQLLRNYGPIWVTTDEDPSTSWAIHARVITGIYGDGTPENTCFKIVDPAGGRRYEESISVFVPKFEEEILRTGNVRIQVVHWQADGRSEQRALSYGRTVAAPSQGMSSFPTQSRAFDYSAAVAAHRQARAMDQTIDCRYNVYLVPQQTGYSCWAAGFSMIVGWRDQVSIDPAEIARATGYWAQYQSGLAPEDTRVMSTWGLVPEPPQTFTVTGFANLLRNYGPLWVASAEPGAHIRVVTGITGDGTPNGTTLYINDPWEQGMSNFTPANRGAQYTETYTQFLEKQSTLARREMDVTAPIYVAHLPRLPAWMNAPAAQSFSAYVGRSIAMEAPANPSFYRMLTSGIWNANTRLVVTGGQGMWFKIRNTNVLGTTIRITDQSGQVKQSIILPMSSVEFVFAIFGNEPMGWRFDISTNSDVFSVTWELWSTWVPGMPPNG